MTTPVGSTSPHLHQPTVRLTAFSEREPDHRGHRSGTAAFAVDGTLDLTVRWSWVESGDGLEVDATGGSARALFGGDLPLVRVVYDAVWAAMTEDDSTP